MKFISELLYIELQKVAKRLSKFFSQDNNAKLSTNKFKIATKICEFCAKNSTWSTPLTRWIRHVKKVCTYFRDKK